MMTELIPSDVREVVAAANAAFMAAFNRGDAAGVASLYTEDGQLLPPNSDFLKGKGAVQAFWQAVLNMGINQAKLDIVEVEAHGDILVEVSMFTLFAGEGQVADQGKYIVIWKQESGQWKLYRDIFNSSMPAPGN